MKIYLDVCCINRPFDDQSQERIRLESEAIQYIYQNFDNGLWTWIGSEFVEIEVGKTPDPIRRKLVELELVRFNNKVTLEDSIVSRAKELFKLGLDTFDSLHIASAETIPVDVFLTTDDGILKVAKKMQNELLVQIRNPLDWIMEQLDD